MRRVYESSDLRGAKSPGAMRRMCGAIAKFSLAVRCSPFTKLRAEETTGARSSGWCRMIAATSSSNTSMAGGYICQGRQIPETTIDCALKLEGRRTMDARAQSDAAAIARAFKVAAHAESGCAARKKIRTVRVGHGPEIRNSHEPAPLQSHFRPALRRSTHDRVLNVVKFRPIEPILPGTGASAGYVAGRPLGAALAPNRAPTPLSAHRPLGPNRVIKLTRLPCARAVISSRNPLCRQQNFRWGKHAQRQA